MKKISNAISKTTFLTSDKDNQNAHWTLEVGAFIRLIWINSILCYDIL